LALLVAGSGCGREDRIAGGRESRHIEIWHGFNTEEAAVFRAILDDFGRDWESKTGRPVELEVHYVSFNDMFTKLKTAALAKATPDIAFVDSIKVTDLALGRALTRLDGLEVFRQRYGSIDNARKEFVAASFGAGVVNRMGEVGLYGIPVQTTCVALFWNREMFRNKAAALRTAGLDPNRPPRDWDELFVYGRILTDPDRGLYAYGTYNSLWFNFPFLNMYNVECIRYRPDGTAEAALDTANGRAALSRILSIVNSGVEGGAWKRSALAPDAGFLNRKYAMILTGPWNVESFRNAGIDFDIGLIPAPNPDEIKTLGLQPADPGLLSSLGNLAYTSTNVGGQSGVVLRSCDNAGPAFEVLDYFTSEPVQRRWAAELGQIPVRLAAWEGLDTVKYPYLPKFMTQLRTARPVPQIPLYGILESDIFNPQMDLLLQGRITPREMLKRMEEGMQEKILDRINERP